MPKIAEETILKIKASIDIVEIIGQHVTLKKSGKGFTGLCPFHQEKSPSFSVSQDKGFYKCFGCGASGDAISFLQQLNKTSFADTVLDLAKQYSVSVQFEDAGYAEQYQRERSLREQLYEVMASASHFYQQQMRSRGESVLRYLQEERGFSAETINQFKLGCTGDRLIDYLLNEKRYSVEIVEQAGLLRRGERSDDYRDFFFGDRLMIPVNDTGGRCIAFSARAMDGRNPKYLNSPETPIFSKGSMVFAMDKARDAITANNGVIVVEGHLDAIALHNAGVGNVVASMGTALSVHQINGCLKHCNEQDKRLYFNFDADSAGLTATKKAIAQIENPLYSGLVNLFIVDTGKHKDANEYISFCGIDGYQDLVKSSTHWLDWTLAQLVSSKDLSKPDIASNVFNCMVSILKQLTDAGLKSTYIHRCAEILSANNRYFVDRWLDRLSSEVDVKGKFVKPSKKPISYTGDRLKGIRNAESLVFRAYLHYPDRRQQIINGMSDRQIHFIIDVHILLWESLKELPNEKDPLTWMRMSREKELNEAIYLICPLDDIGIDCIGSIVELNLDVMELYSKQWERHCINQKLLESGNKENSDALMVLVSQLSLKIFELSKKTGLRIIF